MSSGARADFLGVPQAPMALLFLFSFERFPGKNQLECHFVLPAAAGVLG